ncbi:M15 family metallopeptidase [Azonexus sp.]|jgi:peptidoglycan L-alanyl-D-glutamate endopeptidase CwlK|uniref:M15 family metallopeptidase n=1 Tax=Azonexus sp. TaxID=1872668 RepID=UPI002819621D|nr:M15 family metallopeptidase [Azonexus sp.]MDR1993998.1 M15 family metallopeptidase [Azonexus sp.]
MNIETMIREVQTQLGIQVDGRAGPETWCAIHARIVKPATVPEDKASPTDPRSQQCIATLLPDVRPLALALIEKAALHGITIKVIGGTRSYAEQDALYAKGRSQPGPKVTNARGGYSNHNFGIAFDIGVFEGNRYLGDSPKYKAVGALGMDLGLEWGGNWKTLVDQPHYQLRPAWAAGMRESDMLAELRRRVANGLAVFA